MTPRIAVSRIRAVRLHRGSGVVVVRAVCSVAGRVRLTIGHLHRSFRVHAGANTIRVRLRRARPGHVRVSLQPMTVDGTRGPAVRRRVTLR